MSAEIPDGAVLVARAILNSSLWTMRAEDRVVAMTAIALCNWKARRWFDGLKEIEIGRGQFVRSLKDFKKSCGLSLQKVRTSLEHLEKVGFLTRFSTSTYTLFTLPKYHHYQDLTKYSDSTVVGPNTVSNTELTRAQHALNTRVTCAQHALNNKQEGDIGKQLKEGEETAASEPLQPPISEVPDGPETDRPYGAGLAAPELESIFKEGLRKATVSPVPPPSDDIIRLLLQRVSNLKSTSSLKVWRQVIEGTRLRFGAQAVEEWMSNTQVNGGKSAYDMENELKVLHKGNDLGAKVKLKVQDEKRMSARKQVAGKMMKFLEAHAPKCGGCRACDRDRTGLRELGIPEDQIPRASKSVKD